MEMTNIALHYLFFIAWRKEASPTRNRNIYNYCCMSISILHKLSLLFLLVLPPFQKRPSPTVTKKESITMLKGPDKVRKRPGVIFGSDGVDGCAHSVFEIVSNSIDEARSGFGDKIIVTQYNDHSITVEDFGRGCPVDFNSKENRYNWELVFCELYAGGKYNADGDNYAYSLGLNGLGLCATQFSSAYMDVEIYRDGFCYELHFEKGINIGGLKKTPVKQRKPVQKFTGCRTWKSLLKSASRPSISEMS